MYEYSTAYLMTFQAKNVNTVVELLNYHAEQGWRFTGDERVVQNGSFYILEREIESEDSDGAIDDPKWCRHCHMRIVRANGEDGEVWLHQPVAIGHEPFSTFRYCRLSATPK